MFKTKSTKYEIRNNTKTIKIETKRQKCFHYAQCTLALHYLYAMHACVCVLLGLCCL